MDNLRKGDLVILSQDYKMLDRSNWIGIVFSVEPAFLFPVRGFGSGKGVLLDDESKVRYAQITHIPQGFFTRFWFRITGRLQLMFSKAK